MKLKVMTFNLRVESPAHDGINDLPNRKARILEAIESEAPDIIGFQEARDGTRAWLRQSLTDYVVVGSGRYKGYKGEGAPLAFRKDKLEMIAMDTFWLSSTPKIPESRYEGSDQSECPRIAAAVTLVPFEGSEPFVFLNTHTDHLGSVSRTLSTAQILEYLSEKGLPFVVTGDFNATPDSSEIKMFTANSKYPVTDATSLVGGTYHGFGALKDDAENANEKTVKIDYVFTNMPTDINESYAVTDVPVNGVYISDHRPVVAFVEL